MTFSYYFSTSSLRVRCSCRVNKIMLYVRSFEHRYAKKKKKDLNKGMTNASLAHRAVFPHGKS